jgi:hypothetical protein
MAGAINLLKQVPNRALKTFDIGASNLTVAASPYTVFRVTGLVLIEFLAAYCREDLAGATATVEVGITGNTAGLIAQTTATDIDSGEAWTDASPSKLEGAILDKVVGGNVLLTVATATVTDGILDIVCLWRPLSSTGNLVS